MKRTPMAEDHEKLGGKMVDFHGWYLPIQYEGIVSEHINVREKVGIFDVSHMGNFRLLGKGCQSLLDRVLTNNYTTLSEGRLKYGHILREDGTIIDDMIAGKISEDEFYCVPNATMIDTDYQWFSKHSEDCEIDNVSDETAIIAVQGPKAQSTLQKVVDQDLSSKPFFSCLSLRFKGIDDPIITWRSGYTGEDGFEIMVPYENALSVWRSVVEAGDEFGIKPIGLGARDTLRLEKGLLLSGQDFGGPDSGPRTTLETHWSGKVALDWDHDFIGKEHLMAQKEKGGYDLFVIMQTEQGVPREGMEILHDGKMVGKVTSGTMIPGIRKGMALGYLPADLAKPGTPIQIQIRKRLADAQVISLTRRKRRD